MEIEFLMIWSLAISSFVFLVYLLLSGRKDHVSQRVDAISADAGSLAHPGAGGTAGPSPLMGGATPLEAEARRRIDKQEKKDAFRERILQAGFYNPVTARLLLLVRAILLVAPIGILLLLSTDGTLSQGHAIVLGLAAGGIGTLAPGFWLDHLKKGRQKRVRRALPDALDVIVVCLEGGLSFPGSLARVTSELAHAHPVLALELSIVERELQLGRPIGEALRRFAQRFDLEELRSLASVVSQAERFGSSIVKALNVYADSMRVKRQTQAEEMAQKAVIKILFPTVLCIFPAIFVVLLGPAAIQIYQIMDEVVGNL